MRHSVNHRCFLTIICVLSLTHCDVTEGTPPSPLLTLRSSLMACFLDLLSSLLSSLFRACVETRGRSESLILAMRSACLAVGPRAGRTSSGMPVLLDTRIGLA